MASRKPSSIKPLDRRIPTNPKYATVKSRLDTGSSLSKANERLEYLRSNFKYRKGELFKRIKANTLALLFLEVADTLPDVDIDELDEAATFQGTTVVDGGRHARGQTPALDAELDTASVRTEMTCRSTLLDVVSGIGQRDPTQAPIKSQPDTYKPYLVLDLRDAEAYEKCHITQAISFPHARLSRAQNYFTPQVQAYINKPDRLLVVYDEDEAIAIKAATIMVQRGVENVFLLSGGLKVMAEKFPEGMIVGELPESCRPKGRKRVSLGGSGSGMLPLTAESLSLIRDRLEENLANDTPSVCGSTTSQSTSRTSMSRQGSVPRQGTIRPLERPGTQSSRTEAGGQKWR